MPDISPGEITQLLLDWSHGDQGALSRLMPLVYDDLAGLARRYLMKERGNHTLETSALVHEAYLRLIDQQRVGWKNRVQFLGIAAQMMRRILVDHARGRCAAKRGAGMGSVSLDELLVLPVQRAPDLIALDDALASLEVIDPQQVRIVEMRFFGGLSTDEIALALETSASTIARRWRMIRAWLYHELGESEGHDA